MLFLPRKFVPSEKLDNYYTLLIDTVLLFVIFVFFFLNMLTLVEPW